jgi:hypothetical protein
MLLPTAPISMTLYDAVVVTVAVSADVYFGDDDDDDENNDNDFVAVYVVCCSQLQLQQAPFPQAERSFSVSHGIQNGVYAVPGGGQMPQAAIDAKISSFRSFDRDTLFSWAQRSDGWYIRTAMSHRGSGPTHDQLPPFQFSTSAFNSTPLAGMPDLWDFPWIDVSWH